MRFSTVLFGGLLWKPIRPNKRMKARRRKYEARVRRIEEFLKQYPLNRWRSTAYCRDYWRKWRLEHGLPLYELGRPKPAK
jgi:hypothetical protein